jgi:hypothetical protein
MTPINLIDALKEFIEEQVKDIFLSVRVKGENTKPQYRAAEVHKMRLPDKESETKLIPYILLQFLTGKDTQEPGKDPESECKIRIVVATYSEDGGVGTYDVLNVITRIRMALLKAGIISEQFLLKLDSPLEYIVYTDDTSPYYLGEMVTTWELPAIEREVQAEWQ